MTQDASIPTGKHAEKGAEKPARKAKPQRKARTRQVRKCVEAVHIANNINLVQRKLVNGLGEFRETLEPVDVEMTVYGGPQRQDIN